MSITTTVRELLKKATPGPWVRKFSNWVYSGYTQEPSHIITMEAGDKRGKDWDMAFANAELVTVMHTHAEDLMQAVDSLGWVVSFIQEHPEWSIEQGFGVDGSAEAEWYNHAKALIDKLEPATNLATGEECSGTL